MPGLSAFPRYQILQTRAAGLTILSVPAQWNAAANSGMLTSVPTTRFRLTGC